VTRFWGCFLGCFVMCFWGVFLWGVSHGVFGGDVVVGGWGGVVCGGLCVYGYDGVSTRTPRQKGDQWCVWGRDVGT